MKKKKIKNETLYNGEWGVSYDPQTRTMLGGYSIDGETFSPEFQITEIDSDEVPHAIALCSLLYSEYGTIVSTFNDLLECYENRH